MSFKSVFILLFSLVFLLKNEHITAQNTATKTMQTNLIQPPFLKPGDTVAIVAPSGVLKNRTDEVGRSKAILESWGLKVVIGKHVFSKNGHFAGTDDERCEDFQKALNDPSIKAIWAARGGYGTVRILDKLDYTQFKKNPKWIIGYSDITALHNQLHNLGYETIHAMMCTSLTKDESEVKEAIDTFKDAIFGKQLSYQLKGSSYNKTGTVTAPLVGGNLTVLHTMLGSKTSIDTSGKIIFLEEVGEYAYHIDRMLQSMKRAGYFEDCAGILVGDISRVRYNDQDFGRSIEEIFLDIVSDKNIPVAFNMPAGHEKDNRAMILGTNVTMKVGKDGSSVVFGN
ncbi:MAG: LD-carboxypeptidase [Gelidibacter sp.]